MNRLPLGKVLALILLGAMLAGAVLPSRVGGTGPAPVFLPLVTNNPAGPPAGNISAVGQAAQAQAAQMARQRLQDNASPAGTPKTPTNTPAQQSGVGADVPPEVQGP